MDILKKVFITGFIVAAVGWGGLVWLIQSTVPTIGPRWLFFFLLALAMSGLALPLVAFLNVRFPSVPLAGGSTITRQAAWFGIYACIMAWLQLGRVLNSIIAIAVAIGFILIESFIRIRERSLWKPKESENA